MQKLSSTKIKILMLKDGAYGSWLKPLAEKEASLHGDWNFTFSSTKKDGVYLIIYYPEVPEAPKKNTLYLWFRHGLKAIEVSNVKKLRVSKPLSVNYDVAWNWGAIDYTYKEGEEVTISIGRELVTIIPKEKAGKGLEKFSRSVGNH